jgi:glycerate 2-kinase
LAIKARKKMKLSVPHPRLSGSKYEVDALRSDVLGALGEALKAASPEEIISRRLKLKGEILSLDSISIDLSSYERIIAIGAGKGSASMAAGLERLLGRRITAGVVNCPNYLKPKPKTKVIRLHSATHPIPSQSGVKGVEQMLRIIGIPKRNDLIICLISGGGSSLMPLPFKGITLSDKVEVTELLLKSGATIDEINVVRKHLSGIKGGRLAEMLFPARVVSLIISDVVGDVLASIASGPTVADPSTFRDAKEIIVRYGLWNKIPGRVKTLIESGLVIKSLETPKPNSNFFRAVSNVLLGSNKLSCEAAQKFLDSKGYHSNVLSTRLQGEAREIGKVYSGILYKMKEGSRKSALILGGETTVTIQKESGKGGRNQELVLSSALGIEGLSGALVASMGTDGVDGPTDAAGAVADGRTMGRAKKRGEDGIAALLAHNSYTFFKGLGDLIVTGPTGTNVNDISILAAIPEGR